MADDDSTANAPEATEVVDSPVVTDETTATEDTTTTEPSEASQDGNEETQAAPEADDKLRKYAANQGIELDSPGAIKAAQLAMKNQADKTRVYQKSELEKATQITQEQLPADASTQDANDARVRNLELKYAVQDWKMTNPEKAESEPQMAQYILDNPAKGELVQQGYLTFDDIYSMSIGSSNAASVKSQGKREALTSLAQKQQAAVPTGSATTAGTPKKKDFASLSITEMEKQLGFAQT